MVFLVHVLELSFHSFFAVPSKNIRKKEQQRVPPETEDDEKAPPLYTFSFFLSGDCMMTSSSSYPTICQLYYSLSAPERGTFAIVRPSPPPQCRPTCLSIPVQLLQMTKEGERASTASRGEPPSFIMDNPLFGRRKILFPLLCTEEEQSLFETIRQRIERGYTPDVYSREVVLRIILTSKEIVQNLQQYAVTAPPNEVRALVERNWKPFVEGMREANQATHCTFMRAITSCMTSQGTRVRFVALQLDELLTGFYEKDKRIIGEGTVCQVKRLNPLAPSTNPSLAVAKVKKEFIRLHPFHHVARQPDVYLQKGCDTSQFLIAHGVPYILSMRYIPKLSFRGASVPRVLMEYCEGGTLLRYEEKSLLERMTLGLQLALAIRGMHALGVYHLDLKSENVLLQKCGQGKEIRLGDFGSCVCTKGHQYEIDKGPSYPAPELFYARKAQRKIVLTEKLDAWNFGDLLYCLKYGTSLLCDLGLGWDSKRYEAGLDDLGRRRFSLLQSGDPIDSSIALLLSVDAEERLTADAVVHMLQQWLHVHKS